MGSEGNGGAACAVCGGVAVVYCAADAAALCAACDAAVHSANPLASRHERVPIAVAAAISGVYDLFADDDGESRNSSSSCSDGDAGGDGDGGGAAGRSLLGLLSDVDAYKDFMGYGGGGGGAHLSDGGATAWVQPGLTMGQRMSWLPEGRVVPVVVTGMAAAAVEGREARVRRYKEKRKNRKFQKTIRYASRKAYAEARPRIKGRFIKRGGTATAATSIATGKAASGTAMDASDDVKFWLSFSDATDNHHGGGSGFCMDAATYGVVPSF